MEIAAAASAPAIVANNNTYGNMSGRSNSGRRRNEMLTEVPSGGLTIGEEVKINKRLAQQEYNRQLQEASLQVI